MFWSKSLKGLLFVILIRPLIKNQIIKQTNRNTFWVCFLTIPLSFISQRFQVVYFPLTRKARGLWTGSKRRESLVEVSLSPLAYKWVVQESPFSSQRNFNGVGRIFQSSRNIVWINSVIYVQNTDLKKNSDVLGVLHHNPLSPCVLVTWTHSLLCLTHSWNPSGWIN